MQTHRKTLAITGLLLILLTSCAKTTAPALPPQNQVANAINALASTLDAAITGMRAAREQGKINPADVLNAEKAAGAIATAGKAIDAELRSADPWNVQSKKILGIITASGVQGAMVNVSPTARTYLAAAVALFNQASLALGGPAL